MVEKTSPAIIWSKQVSLSFKKAYEQIKEESYTNAEKVREGVMKIIDDLPKHPEKYPPDKFKRNNPGYYRAFEKYAYRVAYKHTAEEIRILRIRHVKQEPKEY